MRKFTAVQRAVAGMFAVMTAAMLMVPKGAEAKLVAIRPTIYKLRYEDRQGVGTLEIMPTTADPATDGTRISVRLVQNGRTFTGSGFEVRVHEDPPTQTDRQFVDLVVFTLRDSLGRAFVFRGQITSGGIAAITFGGGRYERAGTGVDLDEWKVRNL